MNNPLKTVVRLGGIVLGLGAVVWAMRDKLLPSPQIPDGPPPRYRTPEAEADVDLTTVKGIGPVYAERLNEAGIYDYAQLAAADPAAVADAAGTSESAAKGWIEQAATLS